MKNTLKDKYNEFDEIDLFLKKKYDEITVPQSMFNTEKIYNRIKLERKKRIKKLFLATIFLLIFVIIIYIFLKLYS